MQTVTVHPDQTLKVVIEGATSSSYNLTTTLEISHKDLVARLMSKGFTSKGSNSKGTKFSRRVALVGRAVKTGKWSTGAEIDVKKTALKIIEAFEDLPITEYPNITDTAMEWLDFLRGYSWADKNCGEAFYSIHEKVAAKKFNI